MRREGKAWHVEQLPLKEEGGKGGRRTGQGRGKKTRRMKPGKESKEEIM